MRYSIVVPVFRNEDTLKELLHELARVYETAGRLFETVFVVDGSPDNSYALLKLNLPAMPFPSQLVSLSRNFGAFAAVRAGIERARGEWIGVLAADLQQPVESMSLLFDALERGADIAIGHRSKRSDPWVSRLGSAVFWRLYRRFVQPEVPPGGVDSFACTRQVRDILVGLPEANSTLVGLLFWMGFTRAFVSYPRAARRSGRSGWSLARKLRYAFDSAFAFSDLPITLMMAIGAIGIGGAFAAGVAVLAAWALGAVDVRGYTPLMLVILLSLSTTLLALGVLGGYVWRIFENTKGRPMHIVRAAEAFVPSVAAGSTEDAREERLASTPALGRGEAGMHSDRRATAPAERPHVSPRHR